MSYQGPSGDTCTNGHPLEPGVGWCQICGAPADVGPTTAMPPTTVAGPTTVAPATGAAPPPGPPPNLRCPNGHPVAPDTQYCPVCGARVGPEAVAARDQRLRNVLIGVGGLVVVLVIILVVVLATHHHHKKPVAVPTTTTTAPVSTTAPAASTTTPTTRSTPTTAAPVATTTATTAAPTTVALPTATFGSYTGIKPSSIQLSGDASNIITGITWSSWNSSGASGTGTVDVEGCDPDCADGTQTPTPTSVTLSGVSGGQFTRLTEQVQGEDPQIVSLPATDDSATS